MLPAFSTPIFNDQLDNYTELNNELKALVEQEVETNPGLLKSNVGGWHSEEGFIQRSTALTQSVLKPEFANQPINFNLIG